MYQFFTALFFSYMLMLSYTCEAHVLDDTDFSETSPNGNVNYKQIFQFKVYTDIEKEEAMISYYLEKPRKVYFRFVNDLGEVFTEKLMKNQTQGSYFLPVYLDGIKSGIYYFLLEIDDHTMLKRLEVE